MGDEQSRDVSASTPPDRLAEIESRIEAVDRMARGVVAARRMGGRLRLGFVIGVLAILFFYGWAFMSLFQSVAAELRGQAGKQIVQVILKTEVLPVGKKMLDNLLPVYRKTFQEKGREKLPEIRKRIQPELETLGKNVREAAKEKITSGVKALAERQEAKIRAQLPEELKHPKEPKKSEMRIRAVIENLKKAVGQAAGEVLTDRVEKGYRELTAVYDRMTQFLPKDKQKLQRRLEKGTAGAWKSFVDRMAE